MSVMTSMPLAEQLVEALQRIFDRGVAALAARCSAQGRLDARRLDERQVAAFELAWTTADLQAARHALARARRGGDALEAGLAFVFLLEVAPQVLARLEALYIELELPLEPLNEFHASPAWGEFRRHYGSSRFLEETGGAVAESTVDFGAGALAQEHEMAQAAFRRFAADVVAPLAEPIHRHDQTVPESILGPLREMGTFGLAIPESHGGSGPAAGDDTLLMVLVTEALSEASLAAAGSLITRPEILSRALLLGGTEQQKQTWLPRIAQGEPLCAIAITEPDFGSDVANLKLRGTRTEGGWLLNGAKTWCTFAGKAGLLMVVARTGQDPAGHAGLSVMLVEKPSYETHAFDYAQPGGGLLSGRAIPTIGYRGMHSYDLSFQDFFVPDSHVIGGEDGLGKGFYFTMAGMVGGRMQTAGRACGLMRASLRAAIAYARDRQVFGASLLTFPLTLAKIARMGARLAACRAFSFEAARIVDGGDGRVEAALAKLLSCRSAELISREAMQIHGGMGYAEESAISRYFVDARVLSIFEGAEETLALKVIARGLMERSLAGAAAAAA